MNILSWPGWNSFQHFMGNKVLYLEGFKKLFQEYIEVSFRPFSVQKWYVHSQYLKIAKFWSMCEGNKWHHDYWGRGEAGGGAGQLRSFSLLCLVDMILHNFFQVLYMYSCLKTGIEDYCLHFWNEIEKWEISEWLYNLFNRNKEYTFLGLLWSWKGHVES